MQFTVHAAKTQLSRLIEDALAGKEVIIARGSQPVVRLVAIPQGGFKLGIMRDKFTQIPDFAESLTEQELLEWEGKGNDR